MARCNLYVFLISVTSASWIPQDYPNPQTEPQKCSLDRAHELGYVCDPDSALTAAQIDQLNGRIKHFMQDVNGRCVSGCTHCSRTTPGVYIAVALVKNMTYVNGSYCFNKNDTKQMGSAKQDAAKQFARYLARRWDFGRCGNTLIFFISTGDGYAWLTGSSGVPMCSRLQKVYNENKRYLKDRDWTGALLAMIDSYERQLSASGYAMDDVCQDSLASNLTIIYVLVGLLVTIGIVWSIACIGCQKRARYRRLVPGHRFQEYSPRSSFVDGHNASRGSFGGGGGKTQGGGF